MDELLGVSPLNWCVCVVMHSYFAFFAPDRRCVTSPAWCGSSEGYCDSRACAVVAVSQKIVTANIYSARFGHWQIRRTAGSNRFRRRDSDRDDQSRSGPDNAALQAAFQEDVFTNRSALQTQSRRFLDYQSQPPHLAQAVAIKALPKHDAIQCHCLRPCGDLREM
jgi:hypothetical protein